MVDENGHWKPKFKKITLLKITIALFSYYWKTEEKLASQKSLQIGFSKKSLKDDCKILPLKKLGQTNYLAHWLSQKQALSIKIVDKHSMHVT